MKWIKKYWDKLKGKKRDFGIIAMWILKGMGVFFPDVLSLEQYKFIDGVLDWVLLGGTVDSLRRNTKTGKKVDSTIKKGANAAKETTNKIFKGKNKDNPG